MNMTLLVKLCGNCLVSQSKLSTSLTLPTSGGQNGQEGNIDDDDEVVFEENASMTKVTKIHKI